MNYWLMKSEPGEFSIDDLRRCPGRREPWDGVRNYQARNMMRDQMHINDRAFFYHSACTSPGIVGTLTIASTAYPDATAFDANDRHYDPQSDPANPRWYLVDVKFERKFKHLIPLTQLRNTPALEGMTLLRKGNRLSVMGLCAAEWAQILNIADQQT